MSPHTNALKAFDRRIARLLMVRSAVQWMTLWFFVWGVVVLAVRFFQPAQNTWLPLGIFGFVPLVIGFGLRARMQRPEFAKVRATYDRSNHLGGVLMAEEAADMSAWQQHLPAASVPTLRWQSGRAFWLLSLAGAFMATALLLPERLTHLGSKQPLEIGQLIQELQAEVQTLQEEKIVETPKAEDLKKQLSQMEKEASGLDPEKTWEALDHIKESNAEAAQKATEEALKKITELTQAETFASALQSAAEMGLNSEVATQAAQDLAGMLRDAKLEEGVLQGQIPPELLANLNALSKEDMEKLLQSIQFNKSSLSNTVGKLSKLKMIDPSKLGQCKKAGECKNPGALGEYLSTCTNGSSLCLMVQSYCRGGVNRGRGDAPMTWKDESSAEGAKFKEEALPPSSNFEDAKLTGLSRTAPELSGDEVSAGNGALASATGSGGSAHAEAILPRHRQAVQSFFKRDEK